jgi:glycerol-3-phosphate dehydrogenase
MLGRAVPSQSAAQLLIEPALSAGAPSGTPAASVERLTRRHGTEAAAVLALASERPPLACPVAGGTQVIGAEVVHAIRHEAAITLEDVVVRRTGLGALGHPGAPAARACAAIMAAELGWTAERVEDEIAGLDSFYEIRG